MRAAFLAILMALSTHVSLTIAQDFPNVRGDLKIGAYDWNLILESFSHPVVLHEFADGKSESSARIKEMATAMLSSVRIADVRDREKPVDDRAEAFLRLLVGNLVRSIAEDDPSCLETVDDLRDVFKELDADAQQAISQLAPALSTENHEIISLPLHFRRIRQLRNQIAIGIAKDNNLLSRRVTILQEDAARYRTYMAYNETPAANQKRVLELKSSYDQQTKTVKQMQEEYADDVHDLEKLDDLNQLTFSKTQRFLLPFVDSRERTAFNAPDQMTSQTVRQLIYGKRAVADSYGAIVGSRIDQLSPSDGLRDEAMLDVKNYIQQFHSHLVPYIEEWLVARETPR